MTHASSLLTWFKPHKMQVKEKQDHPRSQMSNMYSLFYIHLSLKPAGHSRHADERVRRDHRDILVKLHHQGLEFFRHLP